MTSRKEKEKLRLFETFAKNLYVINPKYSDIFVCPLCHIGFTKDKVYSELSRGHVWPEALGGKLVTLVCKTCNNQKIGSKIEPHLINSIQNPYKERLFPNPNSSESLGIEMNMVNENTIDIDVIPQISNANILNWRVQEGQEIKVEMKATFRWDRVELTYLHFAYLYLFHSFGYEWIITPFAQRIYQQLNSPDEKIFQVVLSENAVKELPKFELLKDTEPYIFPIIKPKEKIGFAVASPELANNPGHRMVVLFFLSSLEAHMKEIMNTQLGEISLNGPLDLNNSHELIVCGDAKHLMVRTLSKFLLNSGVVQDIEEVRQLLSKSYFS